ncbi:23S rRNA (pseudouridine(1915)-N(3))-methyltransferase RlmH [Sporocytophaga myxococcoides]|uniref:23S rRNA (pseudouridine(1915)-N(3))-methyltransferase RlmH n=1 Tax=Sporocytophaga myxococcoides TaxID=153721 RepID=UPI0005F062B5|nr:23S rRNA (pseudouridine(1915)-N(3))-methyltransferase RlmH [Sporocytophaga myxococcoides]
MKIKLLVVGKTEEDFMNEGIDKYISRLKHYISFEFITIPDVKGGSKLTTLKLKEEEGKLILAKVTAGDQLILLDEKGKDFSSREFSGFIQKKMNSGAQALIFVIGGAFGFSDEVYEKAKDQISLSKMTFSHQMVRLFFTEQLYRAFTILKGEKYHHD